MNRFVPMATTSFQPVGYYVPQPLVVTRANAGMFGATDFGAAKDSKKKGKGKKKGKKKSGVAKFFETTGKAAGNLAKEGAADLLKKKTGIDITGAPADAAAVDTGTSYEDSGSGSGSGSGGEEEKKSNMPLIVGGAVAALLLAGGGFYLYKKKKAAAPAAV